MKKVKAYYTLAKPGIVYGNLLSVVAGFFLASRWHIHILHFLGVMIGIALIIASSCVFNNYIDRKIDGEMGRTKYRPLVTGEISGKAALIYAVILGMIGFSILAISSNLLTVWIGIIGVVFYVVVYGIAKRKTIYGTLIGSISGSMPLVAGYTAVANRIDAAAVLLFLIMAAWQMPHFYAIAIYRLKDYTAAGLMLWPIKKGVESTKRQMFVYLLVFIVSVFLLWITGYTGYLYLFIMGIICILWLVIDMQGFRKQDMGKWGRKMFFFSLIALLVLCAAIAINPA